MMGMEMMLSKMIGMTPDQMAAKVKEFETFVRTGTEALADIAAKQTELANIAATQTEILTLLEAMKNERK